MTFSRALFISFLWHMFCFFAVVIVVSPASVTKPKFSKINFIGAILDKETFGYYTHKKDLNHSYRKDIAEKSAEGDDAAVSFSEERLRYAKLDPYTKPYENSITEIIKEKKYLPSDAPLLIEERTAASGPEIKSETVTRQVLFKPPTPVINRAFQIGKIPSKGEKFQVKLRFLVSPEGKVAFIEKVKSCGYPDIDLVAIRYLKKWQFVPLSPDKPKKNQEGIMLLELEAQ